MDYSETQYWSDVINIVPDGQTRVTLALDLLALDKTNNPNQNRFDGTPPKKEPYMLASLGMISGILNHSVVAASGQEKLYWYINDHLGSPQKIVDENQQVVWEATQEPFGSASFTTATFHNNFRLPGQYFDTESGLHYNYHRYYDPSIGRYITPDPIGLAGGINLFAYANLNSINLIDPFGLLVDILYNKTTGLITVTDRDTGQSITTEAESGGKPFGEAIPTGPYEVLDQARNPDFYRLDAIDDNPRNDIHDPTGRTHFRLHGPGNTIGCIACKDKEKWQSIKDLINSTSTVVVPDNSLPWWKFWVDENIKKFGDLTVCE